MKTVNKPFRKKDSMQLLLGKPVYTDDLAPSDCLVVKLLRSPHANALIKSIDKKRALLVPGIEAIFTYEDIPSDQKRFTCAGQTAPEVSPWDRLILDRHVRFCGDVVAIVAGIDEECVKKALKLIKVEYEVLEPLLDFRKAKDNKILVHPEDNWVAAIPIGEASNKRNICASLETTYGDVEKELQNSDIVLERVYHTKSCQQTMMEPFTTFCTIDAYGRLNVISSTQIVFHARRIVANALGISKAKVRVIKPRIGGGFGAKQTSVSEIYPAFVTWKLKKPSRLTFTREESQTSSSPRHEMELHVKLGASKDGIVNAIDLYVISNTGAYGEHGPTTVGLAGHKSLPLYAKQKAFRFSADVVYTNHASSGAYRGYGATQGLFAIESTVNELAEILKMDQFELRLKNIPHEGEVMPAYYNEVNTSCTLDKCLIKAKEMISWDKKPQVWKVSDTKVRALGMGMAMQSSGISGMDTGGATIRLSDEGTYTLMLGSADMGTGSDTILAQIVAEVLECPLDDIMVFGADTDASPYDSGSYASSTTFVTGKACEKAALELREKIIDFGCKKLGISISEAIFDGSKITNQDNSKSISLKEIAFNSQNFANDIFTSTSSHSCPSSPPPFMVGCCELEVDIETGEVEVIEYDACVDCGTPINPNLARVQAEGGILQGIGMALSENIEYNKQGYSRHNNLMQYKIPTRVDIKKINIEFESSYENLGPFGAKSIGEVVINTPLSAINDALSKVCGIRFTELPIMPEQIALKKQFFRKDESHK